MLPKRSEKGFKTICSASRPHFRRLARFPVPRTLFFGVGARGRRPVESADPEGLAACGPLGKQASFLLRFEALRRRGRGAVRCYLVADLGAFRAALAVRIALRAS